MKATPAYCFNCGYEWKYTGKNKRYATCPFCHKNVKLGGKK